MGANMTPARLHDRLTILFCALPLLLSHASPVQSADTRAQRRTPVVEVFEKSKDAVVNISSTQIIQVARGVNPFFDDFFDFPARPRVQEFKQTSVGSGFVLHADGYIVTNAHVVGRTAERKAIFADKKEYDAQVIAIDTQRDLAVLKIETDKPLKPLPLGTSKDLMQGETVIAIGNPLGYQHTVTAGVVSATDRTLDVGNGQTFTGLVQTDASINPGNSGGPLLNVLGELVGINTAIRGDAQNIGFAIPVDQLRELLPELLDVERRYRIVTGMTVDGDAMCKVTAVKPDSPAAKASVQVGDVIIGLNGRKIAGEIDFHIGLVGAKPGQKLPLLVQRGERTKVDYAADLVLGERPRPDGAKVLRAKFGIEAELLDARLAKSLGFTKPVGLQVNAVDKGSPAEKTGLIRGDIIIQLGRHTPASLDDIGELLEPLKAGERVMISVLRIEGRAMTRANAVITAQ